MWFLHSHVTEEDGSKFIFIVPLLQLHCHAHQDCIKQDLYASPYLYREYSKNAPLMWLLTLVLSYGLWIVTESLWESGNLHKLPLAQVHTFACESLYPDPAWTWINQESHRPTPTRSCHLIWKYVGFQIVCSFLTCQKNIILFFYFGKSHLFTYWVCFYLFEQQSLDPFRKVGSDSFHTSFKYQAWLPSSENYGLVPGWLPFWSTAFST